ncbi:MAG: D-2-hydroxyacid dehydrogenase [Candidatus Acidiferrales bacterium]
MPEPAQTKLVACLATRFDQWRFPDWLATAIRQRYPGLRVVHLKDYSRLEEELREADIFVGWGLKREQFAAAKKLKWVHTLAAGVNQWLRDDILASNVVITNARHVHAATMAEHALALILALARRLPSAARYQQRKYWAQQDIWDEEPHPMEINGRTLVIVGYGAIGKELGQRAHACGMRVVGVKRDPTQGGEHADSVVGTHSLDAALTQADFVVLATPLTPETEHLFNTHRFRAMKKTAYFINVGRGALVDEAGLLEALRKKQIAGAALDVTEEEPLPPTSPLWEAPNLFLTPHIAGVSDRLWHRHSALLLENLDRYFAGRELLNVVDKVKGY